MATVWRFVERAEPTGEITMKIKHYSILLGLVWLNGLASSPLQAQCVPAPAGLIAWWRAENNALDAAGMHQGTLMNGTTCAPGQVGQAFSFDGVDDFVSVPDSTAWDLGMADFTIELWTKLNQIQNSMFIHQQSGTDIGGFEFDVQPLAGGLFFARDPAHAAISRAWSPVPATWYHLAVTRTQGSYRLYVDGQQLDAEQPDSNPVADVTGPLRIGNWARLGYALNGLVDELTIYNRALSAAEIQALFNSGSVGKCFRAIDWFKIADGGGTANGGGHSLLGTIGQQDAGGPLTNSQFSLVGGFLALPKSWRK